MIIYQNKVSKLLVIVTTAAYHYKNEVRMIIYEKVSTEYNSAIDTLRIVMPAKEFFEKFEVCIPIMDGLSGRSR